MKNKQLLHQKILKTEEIDELIAFLKKRNIELEEELQFLKKRNKELIDQLKH